MVLELYEWTDRQTIGINSALTNTERRVYRKRHYIPAGSTSATGETEKETAAAAAAACGEERERLTSSEERQARRKKEDARLRRLHDCKNSKRRPLRANSRRQHCL